MEVGLQCSSIAVRWETHTCRNAQYPLILRVCNSEQTSELVLLYIFLPRATRPKRSPGSFAPMMARQ